MLVANKGERGKKKLADKWEDGVYTVIGADPSIHVYKVQDAAGHTRVVHRNLLMEVNFLPVPRVCRNGDTVGADLSLVSEEGCDDGGEATSLFGVLAQDEVQNLPGSLDREESAISSSEDSFRSDMIDSEEHPSPISVTCPNIPALSTVSDSDRLPTPHDSSPVTYLSVSAGQEGPISTRAGRLVKSVNRLIESMVQKPFLKGSHVPFGNR